MEEIGFELTFDGHKDIYKWIKAYQVKGTATKSQNSSRMSILVIQVYSVHGRDIGNEKAGKAHCNYILENLRLHVTQFGGRGNRRILSKV